MNNTVKAVIATTLVAALIVAAVVIVGKKGENQKIERLNEIVAAFKDLEKPPTEVPLATADVELLLTTLATGGARDRNERPTFLQALNIGKATDGTDITARVAQYASETALDEGLRQNLFQLVGARGDKSALPHLISYAKKSERVESARAALRAAQKMATTDNFRELLVVVTSSNDAGVKNAAVDALQEIIKKSNDPISYASPILTTYRNTPDDQAKAALLRLMGAAGGDEAAKLVSQTLDGNDKPLKIYAIFALQAWPDDSQFEYLLEFTKNETDTQLRNQAFNALVTFLKDSTSIDSDDLSLYWSDLSEIAVGQTEQQKIVDAMVNQTGAWANDILDFFIEKGDNDRVQFRAEKAKAALAENLKRLERGAGRRDSKKDEKDEDDE